MPDLFDSASDLLENCTFCQFITANRGFFRLLVYHFPIAFQALIVKNLYDSYFSTFFTTRFPNFEAVFTIIPPHQENLWLFYTKSITIGLGT